jgi:hypothetical protein
MHSPTNRALRAAIMNDECLKDLELTTIKTRRIRGNMTKIFKFDDKDPTDTFN